MEARSGELFCARGSVKTDEEGSDHVKRHLREVSLSRRDLSPLWEAQSCMIICSPREPKRVITTSLSRSTEQDLRIAREGWLCRRERVKVIPIKPRVTPAAPRLIGLTQEEETMRRLIIEHRSR